MGKIAFLIIGTNNYVNLAVNCSNSIRNYVQIDGYDIESILFTNSSAELNNNLLDININNIHDYLKHIPHICLIHHLPWPLITLLRYQFFIEHEELLKNYDYLYYIDADMKVVAPIGKEILGERVATQHPGLYGQDQAILPFERNSISTACITKKSSLVPCPTAYYFGALQGGSSKEFLKMSRVLRDRINEDLKKNYIAVWHDESQMNKYFFENPPDVILGKEFAYVDKWFKNSELEKTKKIVCLEKDHDNIRKE